MANRSNFVPSMFFVIFLSKFVNFRVSFQLELVFNLKYPGNELGIPSCSCLHLQSALNFIQYLSKTEFLTTGSQVNVTSPLKQSDGVISRADDYWNRQLFRSEFLLPGETSQSFQSLLGAKWNRPDDLQLLHRCFHHIRASSSNSAVGAAAAASAVLTRSSKAMDRVRRGLGLQTPG